MSAPKSQLQNILDVAGSEESEERCSEEVKMNNQKTSLKKKEVVKARKALEAEEKQLKQLQELKKKAMATKKRVEKASTVLESAIAAARKRLAAAARKRKAAVTTFFQPDSRTQDQCYLCMRKFRGEVIQCQACGAWVCSVCTGFRTKGDLPRNYFCMNGCDYTDEEQEEGEEEKEEEEEEEEEEGNESEEGEGGGESS